ncbi:MAG: hypothetical protein ACF8NJ_05505, partial [Phycisphaerales bacterium JB038]
RSEARDSLLHEIEPGHWLGLWRTEALRDSEPTPPVLDYRVPVGERQALTASAEAAVGEPPSAPS